MSEQDNIQLKTNALLEAFEQLIVKKYPHEKVKFTYTVALSVEPVATEVHTTEVKSK